MNSIVKQNIIIEQKGDVLVVDSRLIAQDLGIEHESFMRTIKKYETRMEQRFGVIRFEIGKPTEGSLGGRPEKFAWLTEDQSLFLMTLSRNTDQVVECKANLVEAFIKARKLLEGDRQEPIRQIPTRDTIDYIQAAAILPTLQVNCQLRALLEDALTDEIELMRNVKALPSGVEKKEYTIVKVRAQELGYKVDSIKSGSQLGRYVSKHITEAFKKRVGDYMVKHYEVTPKLDETIHSFFNSF